MTRPVPRYRGWMAPIIVFDVNETLLNLMPIRLWFNDRYGGEVDAAAWFGELLRLSFVSAVTERYVPFPNLAGHALTTVTRWEAAGETTPDDVAHLRSLFTQLPAHPDVGAGLSAIRDAGFRTAALTNSPLATAQLQLENAGIRQLFDDVMSVEMVNRFKPHGAVYRAAADKLNASPHDLVMVAAHDWDIAGAMAAGLEGVFVARPQARFSAGLPKPTLIVHDIEAAAPAIIDRYQ